MWEGPERSPPNQRDGLGAVEVEQTGTFNCDQWERHRHEQLVVRH